MIKVNNIQHILYSFITFYRATRGSGHTERMIKGIRKTKDCVITSNRRIAQYLKIKNPISIEGFDDYQLRGRNGPIAWDNSAILDVMNMSYTRIKELEEENTNLKNKLDRIKSII